MSNLGHYEAYSGGMSGGAGALLKSCTLYHVVKFSGRKSWALVRNDVRRRSIEEVVVAYFRTEADARRFAADMGATIYGMAP